MSTEFTIYDGFFDKYNVVLQEIWYILEFLPSQIITFSFLLFMII